MARNKKNPSYNPDQLMQDFMDTIADAFGEYDDRDDQRLASSLNAVATEFDITALKARKLLITAGVYSTEHSRHIADLIKFGAKVDQIMRETSLSRASVHSYLPYTKIPYRMEELSANAGRIKRYRQRKAACAKFCSKLAQLSTGELDKELWELLKLLEGCVFLTAKGLKFSYCIRGGEMFVNRKSKSITQATVFMSFHRALELGGKATGPKKLGTFGASYLYPIFVRIGIIEKS